MAVRTSRSKKSEYNAMIFNFSVLVRAKEPNCIESYIGDGYSRVPNKRVGWNNSVGGTILAILINVYRV